MSRTAESPLSSLMRAEPLGVLGRRHERQQLGQHFAEIADERDVHVDVLVHFGRIDLDVDLLRVAARRS